MVRRRRPPQWHLLLSGAVLILAVVGGVYLSTRVVRPHDTVVVTSNPSPLLPPTTAPQFAQRLHSEVDSILAQLGIASHLIQTDPDTALVQISVGVPRDLPLAAVNLHLTRNIQALGGRVMEGLQASSRRVDLRCGFDSTQTTLFVLRRRLTTTRRTGQIGLIVRDVVLPAQATDGIWAVPQRLTLLLKQVPASQWTQLRQWAYPADHRLLEDRGTGGADAVIPAKLARHLADQPTILDSDPQPGAIERQLWALAERAADDGSAIGVINDHPASHAALAAVLPRLEQRGYRFVAAATLLP
ncbi:MAG: hypothetical protein HN404_26380 [Gemmatimonadetes bacterium]|nr:hypothetical protein [Gemmatimonadota bacterium]